MLLLHYIHLWRPAMTNNFVFQKLRTVLLGATVFACSTALADAKSVNLQVFTPKNGDVAGVQSRAFLIDLVARFDGKLAATGASPELTGPGAHLNAAPFPGTFSPGANADHLPGLVVLLSSTTIGA